MTLAELTKAAQAAGLIGDVDGRTVARRYRKYAADPGDCAGDEPLIMGLAIADAFIGTGHPGWIPVVQKTGCEIAELVN